MNVKRFMATLLGILSSVVTVCNQLPNYGSERPTFMKEIAAIVFTTAAPIMVQFGGYGYFIAFIFCLVGFVIELFVLRTMLRLPYAFMAIRLLIAHGLALAVQLVVGLFVFGIFAAMVAFGFAAASMQKNAELFFSAAWLLLLITALVILFVVITNMMAQYYVLCWRNKELQPDKVKKAVIRAGVVSYILVLVVLVTINHFSTIFKDARVNCKKGKKRECVQS